MKIYRVISCSESLPFDLLDSVCLFNDNDLPKHALGLVHYAGVPVHPRNGESMSESLAWTEKPGVGGFGAAGIRDFLRVYGQGWVAGRMMYLISDILPLDALT